MNLTGIVARHFESVVTYVRRRAGREVRRKDNLSDIVQSTFRELVQAQPRLEDRKEESIRRWLREAAECKIRNRARHWAAAKREAGREGAVGQVGGVAGSSALWQPTSPDPSPASEVAFREVEERLERAFESLPVDYREVIRLAKVEGLTHSEIAARMGRGETATRKLLSRALARLSIEMAS